MIAERDFLVPVSVAQWVNPLIIGHSACWADGK